jgi:integrase
MPRLTNRTPRYSLHRPSGQARVRLDGRHIYLGRYGSPESKAEYDRLIAEWLAHGRRLPPAAPAGESDLTVTELLLRYWTFARGYYLKRDRPTSELNHVKLALQPLRRLYGATPARDFGPTGLKTIRQGWIDGDLTRKEINKRVGRIIRCFRWAVEAELVAPAVHQALKAVAGLRAGRSAAKESEPVRPVADDQVETIRPFVSRQVWAMIELQRLTGMRSGEVAIMRTGDIDRSGDVWVYTPRVHKSEHAGKVRQVFLGPLALELLREWLKADPDAYLFSPAEAMAEHRAARSAARRTPMTPSQRARTRKARPRRAPRTHYTTDTYGQAVTNGIVKANRVRAKRGEPPMAHWFPHQLRHSAATSIRKQFGLETARILLGHTSAIVTQLYAEADRQKAVEAVRLIG